MPYFSKTEGIKLFKEESGSCDSCDLFPCQVYTDLMLDGEESKYDGVRILRPDQEENNKLKDPCLFCQSWKQYTPPGERSDPDPYFGKTISVAEANEQRGIPPDTPWDRPLPERK